MSYLKKNKSSRNSSLLIWGGFCAIVYGLLNALSYIIYIVGLGFPPITASKTDPIKIMMTHSSIGVGISLHIDWLSYMFLFPALVGILFYLQKTHMGLSIMGFIFGIVTSISDMLSSFFLLSASNLLEGKTTSAPLFVNNQVVLFHTFAVYLSYLTFPLTGLFYLLWGFGFRRGSRPDRIVGATLIFSFLFLLLTHLASLLNLGGLADVSLMLKVFTVNAFFIMTGRLMRKDEEYESIV